MLGPVFFSSVIGDKSDDADLLEFCHRLQAELQLLAGRRDLRVHTSLDDFAPDEDESEALQLAFEVGAVMVPFVTPSYLVTPWTRNAVTRFEQLCRDDGVLGMIVPVMWLRTPELDRPDDDPVPTILKSRGYVDFTEQRYEPWHHPGKKRALANLARTVFDAQKRGARGSNAVSVPRATPTLLKTKVRRATPADERELAGLLVRMYTAAELRHLPLRLPSGQGLLTTLPPPGANAAALAMALVRALCRLDATDDAFFDVLRKERSLRRREIDAVARRFGR